MARNKQEQVFPSPFPVLSADKEQEQTPPPTLPVFMTEKDSGESAVTPVLNLTAQQEPEMTRSAPLS